MECGGGGRRWKCGSRGKGKGKGGDEWTGPVGRRGEAEWNLGEGGGGLER